jgi:hypothetical protein
MEDTVVTLTLEVTAEEAKYLKRVLSRHRKRMNPPQPPRPYPTHSRGGRLSKSALARFEAKVVRTPTCWMWTAARTNGYGHFGVAHGDIRKAHRVAYEHFVGPIPPQCALHHTCGVRACVNPAHLEPVDIHQHAEVHRAAA